MSLTFGSLFAGIGGIDLGLERAGMTCKWQVEMDDYATRVLKKHWPDVPRYRDVRDVGAANLERVDLICGGFPCQDVSLAGKRAGLEGKRTTLWSEFARIIRELEPRWVLAENVPGLRSSDNGRFFGNILRDLAESGYDAEWDCIPAAAVGAPHRRDRVFIMAYPQGDGKHHESKAPVFGACFKEALSRMGHGRGTVGRRPHASSSMAWNNSPWRDSGRPRYSPTMVGVANGVPSRVDRLRCLGNAVVPQVAELVGRMIMEVP